MHKNVLLEPEDDCSFLLVVQTMKYWTGSTEIIKEEELNFQVSAICMSRVIRKRSMLNSRMTG